MGEINEDSEFWKQYREEQKERRKNRLPELVLEIYSAGGSFGPVQKLTEYQFRINGKIDIYPIHKRYHIIKTGKRGSYSAGKLEETLKKYLNPLKT